MICKTNLPCKKCWESPTKTSKLYLNTKGWLTHHIMCLIENYDGSFKFNVVRSPTLKETTCYKPMHLKTSYIPSSLYFLKLTIPLDQEGSYRAWRWCQRVALESETDNMDTLWNTTRHGDQAFFPRCGQGKSSSSKGHWVLSRNTPERGPKSTRHFPISIKSANTV